MQRKRESRRNKSVKRKEKNRGWNKKFNELEGCRMIKLRGGRVTSFSKDKITSNIVADSTQKIDKILKTKLLTNKVSVNIEGKSITIRGLDPFLKKMSSVDDPLISDIAHDLYQLKDNLIATIMSKGGRVTMV